MRVSDRSNRLGRALLPNLTHIPVPELQSGADAAAPAPVRARLQWLSPGRLALLLIVIVGAVLRLPHLSTPLVETHGWRQVETASIARALFEERFNPFYPKVNWGGPDGYVESEFPLVPALAAAAYHAFGPDVKWGRAVSLLFALSAIWATAALGTLLIGAGAGRAAALLVATSPAFVFYGRAFMPDTPMVCLSLVAVYGFARYLRAADSRMLLVGAVAAALAWLVKLPSIVIVPVLMALAWEHGGRAALTERRFVLALVLPLIAAAAWYLHAYRIFLETGLTFGILAHPAKTYPATVAFGPWEPFDKWSTVALLVDTEFYRTLLARLWITQLTPVGVAGAAVGLLLWPQGPGRLAVRVWLGILVLFVLAAGHGHLAHDYYQLPLIPVGALFFGAAVGPFFEGSWLARHIARGWKGPLAAGVVAVLLALAGYYFSGVSRSHFRQGRLDTGVIRAGQAIDRVLPAGELLVVADEFGVTSPMLLYFSHADGWSFDVTDLSPQMIARLHDKGARYFATTIWPRIESQRPMVAAYLDEFESVPLGRVPGGTRLVDLSRPKGMDEAPSIPATGVEPR